MPNSALARINVCLSFALLVASTVKAQVPTRASEPRLAPAREPVLPAPGQPTVAPAAAAQPAQPAPVAEPAPVSAAPAPTGVTQLPPAGAPPTTTSSSQAATAARSYAAGKFGLALEGVNVGNLKAVAGGAAAAEVVVEQVGPDNVAKKHVAGVRYEPLSFDVGLDSKQIMDWIGSSWKNSSVRKDGSIMAADFDYTVRSERQFSQAVITGTTIPALDASSKDAGYLTVTIGPEAVREIAGSGKLSIAAKGGAKWVLSNFRFEMGDLDGTRVTKIETFTVGQKVVESSSGEMRKYEKESAGTVFPDLHVTMSQVAAPSWAKWHEDFVIKGNNGDAQEKNGAIIFTDPTRKQELARINLYNCGIYRFGAEPQVANNEAVARAKADLYCERMELVSKIAS